MITENIRCGCRRSRHSNAAPMYNHMTALVGLTAQANAANDSIFCTSFLFKGNEGSHGKWLKATTVKDVSREFDIDRESDRAWNREVKDKKSVVGTYFSPRTRLVSSHTQISVTAAKRPCKILGPQIHQ